MHILSTHTHLRPLSSASYNIIILPPHIGNYAKIRLKPRLPNDFSIDTFPQGCCPCNSNSGEKVVLCDDTQGGNSLGKDAITLYYVGVLCVHIYYNIHELMALSSACAILLDTQVTNTNSNPNTCETGLFSCLHFWMHV